MLKSGNLRLVVRKSLRSVQAQVVKYETSGDKTLLSVSSKDLKALGWKAYGRNTPAAYLVGLLCGQKAKAEKIDHLILDLGLYRSDKGSILYSVLKGVVDAGVDVPHKAAIFPSDERVEGKHISDEVSKQFAQVKASIEKVK